MKLVLTIHGNPSKKFMAGLLNLVYAFSTKDNPIVLTDESHVVKKDVEEDVMDLPAREVQKNKLK